MLQQHVRDQVQYQRALMVLRMFNDTSLLSGGRLSFSSLTPEAKARLPSTTLQGPVMHTGCHLARLSGSYTAGCQAVTLRGARHVELTEPSSVIDALATGMHVMQNTLSRW